jgi:alanyl-tRNA synthetase
VVNVTGYSKDFCGGTHVSATGEIGPFKIISERGLAAGVRRLVALTGPKALERFSEDEVLLAQAQDRFQIKREQFMQSLEKMQAEKRELEAKVEALKMELAKGGQASERIEDLGDFKVIAKAVKAVGGGQLRQLADEMLKKVSGGVVLLASDNDGKAQLVVKSAVKAVHAGKLVGEMATIVGGRGGGKPDMAMAGGKDTSQLEAALEKGLTLLRESVNANA